MITRNSNFVKKNIHHDPVDLPEAYDLLYLLTSDIGMIETQLADKERERSFSSSQEYHGWRKKANIALAMKLKQLESTKKWINAHGGKAPTEENDNVKPENICLGENSRLAMDSRPDSDKIIDNMCNSIIQLRSLKRRLYPFYKIANAAFDLAKELGIETTDPTDVVNQLVYWLNKAGYNTKEIDGYLNDPAPDNNDQEDWDDNGFDEWDK